MPPRPRTLRPAIEALLLTARSLLRRPHIRRRLRDNPDAAQALFRDAIVALLACRLGRVFEALPVVLEGGERDAINSLLPESLDEGQLYEQLLSLTPRLDIQSWKFDLILAPGNSRKRLGSYSTPDCLIDLLLRSTLDPILSPDLRICDPACGCGRLLIAAARRMARSLGQPFREVALSCVFGVDRDPVAVDLCRMALWRACEDRELPLSAFDASIRCGNSLVGAMTPAQAGDDPDLWTARHLGDSSLSVLRTRHSFFHWPHEFPDRFHAVLCNPPWEHVKHQEKDRAVEESRFLRTSGRFPLSARGDLNYYGPFVETCRQLVRPGGRVGVIVPSGIATDDSMKALFQSMVRDDLVSWYDFHNRARLFPDVQGNIKFGLLTLAAATHTTFHVAAQLSHPSDLDSPGRVCTLDADRIAVLNPNTLHCPTFTSVADCTLVERVHRRFRVLVREGASPENPWNVRPWTMFHMTKDAPLFRRAESLRRAGAKLQGNVFRLGKQTFLPLWESKFIGAFTCRAATFAGVAEAVRFRTHARTRSPDSWNEPVLPRYWVDEVEVQARAGDARWFLGFRNAISTVADSRSLVAAIIPRAGVGNSLPLLAGPDSRRACLLLALLNSFALDHVLRQKASGGNLNFHVLKQLPVLPPSLFERRCPWSREESAEDWILGRVLRLVYDDRALRSFALGCGYSGRPFRIDEEARFATRCELDAACFHLYGLSRPEIEHVFTTFEVLARKEQRQQGHYRSAEGVLAAFDRLRSSG
jgi:hypothetical protein